MEIAHFRDVDMAAIYEDLAEKRGRDGRPFTLVNMVSTLDGKAAQSGVAGQLGSQVDHRLMRMIRAGCDALLYGSGTLRAENVDPRVPDDLAAARQARGTAAQPLRVAVASGGELPFDNLFFRAQGERPVLFVARIASRQARARLERVGRVFVAGEQQVDLAQAVAILSRDFGVHSMVVEGGPTLSYTMLVAGLADELFLTLAPKVVGDPSAPSILLGPPVAPRGMPALTLLSVYRHESELFLRYAIEPSGDRSRN